MKMSVSFGQSKKNLSPVRLYRCGDILYLHLRQSPIDRQIVAFYPPGQVDVLSGPPEAYEAIALAPEETVTVVFIAK